MKSSERQNVLGNAKGEALLFILIFTPVRFSHKARKTPQFYRKQCSLFVEYFTDKVKLKILQSLFSEMKVLNWISRLEEKGTVPVYLC